MGSRAVNFPAGPSYGDVHFEHGRAWEYVAPGVWRSISTGGEVDWDDVNDKPVSFPPADHQHQIDDVTGLQDALDSEEQARVAGDNALQKNIDSEASTRKSEDDALQAKIDKEAQDREAADTALDLRIDAVEDSVTNGGGFIDAPNDGKLYGRQSESWAEVPDGGVSDWADIENKPTEYPPAAHDQPWSSITNTPTEYPPSTHDHPWSSITGKPTEYPPAAHNQPWSTITNTPSEYPPSAHTHEIDEVNGLQDALDNAGGSSGPPVHVNPDPPDNPETGDLWFDTDDSTLNLFDGNDWLAIGTGSKTIFTLPISLRSGAIQLPVNDDGDALPVMLRSGGVELPLNDGGDELAVMTRGGELELPLAA